MGGSILGGGAVLDSEVRVSGVLGGSAVFDSEVNPGISGVVVVQPLTASQLVDDVVTSTIRMVGSGRGAPDPGAPEGGITVPADTSDAEGQYPSLSGSHRISVTTGVDPVSVAAGAK